MITKFGLKTGIILWILCGLVLYIFGIPTIGKDHDPASINIWEIGLKAFNILLLLDIIFYAVRVNFRDFFKKRENNTRQELRDAKKDRKEMERRLDDVRTKLETLDKEIDSILRKAQDEADEEKKMIIENAEVEARKIIELTKKEVEAEFNQATRKLKENIAMMSLQKSREIIDKNIVQRDHEDIIKNNIKDLEGIK